MPDVMGPNVISCPERSECLNGIIPFWIFGLVSRQKKSIYLVSDKKLSKGTGELSNVFSMSHKVE